MKFKKKLLIFCPSIEEGGVEKNLINITNSLSNFYDISLITANFNKRKFFSKKVKFISPKSNLFNDKNRFLKSLISSFLYIKNYSSRNIVLSFQANILAIVLSKVFLNKIIIRSNTAPSRYITNIFKKIIFSLFFKLADRIIVNSNEFNKEFNKFFNIKPTTIYNPIENVSFLKKKANEKISFKFFEKSKDILKIVSVGRLVDQKDHMTILRAINEIKKKRKMKLCLIGKGVMKKKLEKFIKSNQLSKIVKLVGYKKNIYPFLKKSDLFILSSIYEGLPNTLIEALTFGLKILSSDCKTGPKEILNKKSYGKLYKVGDYKKLSKLILITKKRSKNNFIEDKRFNFENNLQKYKNVIMQV